MGIAISVVLPFALLLLTGMFAAYHRLRLGVWVVLNQSLNVIGKMKRKF